eukprot:338725-Pelagomonas_calceolata.AAC.3
MWGQHQAVGSLRMGDEAERMDQHQIDEVGGTGGRQEGVGVVEHQGVVDQQQTQVGLDERRKQKQKERRQRRKQRARKEREERENQLEKKVAGGAGQQEPEEQQVPAKLQGQQQHSKQPASYILQAPPPPLQQQQRQQQQSECLQGLQQDAGAQLRTGVQHSSLQQNIRQGRSQGVQQQSDTQQHEALWPALSGAQLQGQLPLGDVVQALHQSLQLLPGLGSTHGLEYLSLDGQCISREEVCPCVCEGGWGVMRACCGFVLCWCARGGVAWQPPWACLVLVRLRGCDMAATMGLSCVGALEEV